MSIKLKEYINRFFPMDEAAWQTLSSHFSEVHYKKGEHIYSKGETANALCFITDGLIRSYKLEEDGKEYTWRFHCLDPRAVHHRMLIDIVVVDYVSFTQNVPEEISFEAMTDASLVRIDKKDLEALYAQSAYWQRFGAKIAEDAYAILRERTFWLLTKSAKERVELLVKYFPLVFEFGIPTEYIATYLGITRQSLNRIKRELGIDK